LALLSDLDRSLGYVGQQTDVPYLQVRNSRGDLVGLMRGPFQAKWLSYGSICFLEGRVPNATVGTDRFWSEMKKHEMLLQKWAQGRERWVCLLSDLPIETLKRIPMFR